MNGNNMTGMILITFNVLSSLFIISILRELPMLLFDTISSCLVTYRAVLIS